MSDFTPQRVVSLQPSITVTLDRLGLLSRVVACTRYCVDVCPSLSKDNKIIVADSWTAKSSEILAANPDMVMAAVPYQLEAVAEILKAGIPFLALAPHSLHDVYCDIVRIAGIMGVNERGEKLVRNMQSAIDAVRAKATAATARPRVYCEEWGKPLIHSQAWVKELVETAGGEFIGTPGAHTDEDAIRAAHPDIILAAWCGAGDRVPLEKLVQSRHWEQTSAARNHRVYCITDEFLNTPGPTLIAGLHAIAAAIHPEIFPAFAGLRRIATADPGSGP